MNIHDFQKLKNEKQAISMITCYGYPNAQIISETDIDCILVGDSSAMVIHGHDSTVTATLEMIATHIRAVKRGASNKFIIGDLPFLPQRAICRRRCRSNLDASRLPRGKARRRCW
jgi:3-methyl-2-oxobutanoate hydroxymethyltransferase